MAQGVQSLLKAANEVILGKERQLRLAVTCVLARGHLLIEDLPGVGKTTLAQVIARLLGLRFQRIQFTSDLLPADILGASVYDRESAAFTFHPGPIFAHMILADGVNRATPKAQSALLEAMEEQQVTAEGETRPLPEPFFVIATQNPGTQVGTFPLPESQLDRFLLRIGMGYPDRAAETELLRGRDRRELIAALAPATTPSELAQMQVNVRRVHAADALIEYIQALLEHSRRSPRFRLGLSPRAGLALLHAAQAWAWMEDRGAVLPEVVQAASAAVAGHRLAPAEDRRPSDAAAVEGLLGEVPVP